MSTDEAKQDEVIGDGGLAFKDTRVIAELMQVHNLNVYGVDKTLVDTNQRTAVEIFGVLDSGEPFRVVLHAAEGTEFKARHALESRLVLYTKRSA